MPPTLEQVVTSDSGLMILTKSGELYSRGAATGDSSSWTLRASNVADFSMWGFTTNTTYVGGTYIDRTGQVYRFLDSGQMNWMTPERVNLSGGSTPLANVVQSFSSDGTYLFLTSDGKVYAAGGNIDNASRTGAQLVNTGTGTVRDLDVWGLHVGDNYYGGGFVIKGPLSC